MSDIRRECSNVAVVVRVLQGLRDYKIAHIRAQVFQGEPMSDAMIRFACPRCDKPLKSGPGTSGRWGKCNRCKQAVVIPETASPASTARLTLNHALLNVENLLESLGETELVRHFAELRLGLDRPELRVVIFGEFNRGKSTLINALLGRVVLSAKLVPTTGHVTQIVFGTREEVRVQMADGRKEVHGLDRLDSFSSLDCDGLAREDIETIEVVVNCPLLRDGVVLVDTPGINEKDAQTRRAVQAIAQADLVLLVMDARQLLTGDERSLAVNWLIKDLGKIVVPVVNFMNFLEEADCLDVRLRLDQWCKSNLRHRLKKRLWFEANALAALRHAVRSGPTPSDDFQSLGSALADCTGPRRQKLQHRSRHGQLLSEVRQARQQNLNVLHRIRTDAAKEESERVAKRRDLEELRRRFDVNAKAERERVILFAQKKFDRELEQLLACFVEQEKATLEAQAERWYEDSLIVTIRAIEKEADGALLSLVNENLARPEPVTVQERMVLSARLQVGDLPATRANDNAIGWGAGIGAAIGTFLVPGPGTVLGAGLGAWLGILLSQKNPDYAMAFSTEAKDCWEADAQQVLKILRRQFDNRRRDLKRQLDELQDPQPRCESSGTDNGDHEWRFDDAINAWVAPDPGSNNHTDAVAAFGQPLAEELRQRELLDNALTECEQQLIHFARRA